MSYRRGLSNCRNCRFLTSEGICIAKSHSTGFRPNINAGCSQGEKKPKIELRWMRDGIK